MKRTAGHLSWFVAVALAAAACGGGGTPSVGPTLLPTAVSATAAPSATAPASLPPLETALVLAPCELITQDEADQLAGTPTASGIPSGPSGTQTMCQWTGDPTKSLGQVEVFVGDGAKKFLDIDKDTLGHTFKSVAGLGDEAWAEDNAIFFRMGDLWIGLHLVRLNDPAANAKPLEELARRIAERL